MPRAPSPTPPKAIPRMRAKNRRSSSKKRSSSRKRKSLGNNTAEDLLARAQRVAHDDRKSEILVQRKSKDQTLASPGWLRAAISGVEDALKCGEPPAGLVDPIAHSLRRDPAAKRPLRRGRAGLIPRRPRTKFVLDANSAGRSTAFAEEPVGAEQGSPRLGKSNEGEIQESSGPKP